jgi:hypothetical protein
MPAGAAVAAPASLLRWWLARLRVGIHVDDRQTVAEYRETWVAPAVGRDTAIGRIRHRHPASGSPAAATTTSGPASASTVPPAIAWLYPVITDGLALVAYAAAAHLHGSARRLLRVTASRALVRWR